MLRDDEVFVCVKQRMFDACPFGRDYNQRRRQYANHLHMNYPHVGFLSLVRLPLCLLSLFLLFIFFIFFLLFFTAVICILHIDFLSLVVVAARWTQRHR